MGEVDMARSKPRTDLALTHDEVVVAAVRWLCGTARCSLALAEPYNPESGPIPDAIGWRPNGWSIAVEVKVSIRDFHRDAEKPFSIRTDHFGQHRYYLAPRGLLTADMIPEDMGFLELTRGGVRTRRSSPERDFDYEILRREFALLWSACRKAGFQEGRNQTWHTESSIRGAVIPWSNVEPEELQRLEASHLQQVLEGDRP